jgi:hypothetical protein
MLRRFFCIFLVVVANVVVVLTRLLSYTRVTRFSYYRTLLWYLCKEQK